VHNPKVFAYRVRHIELGSIARDKLRGVSKTSYESVKELLDFSGSEVANVTIEISYTTCNVSHASGEVTQLGLRDTEGTFDHFSVGRDLPHSREPDSELDDSPPCASRNFEQHQGLPLHRMRRK
jgi:hypothetical protein